MSCFQSLTPESLAERICGASRLVGIPFRETTALEGASETDTGRLGRG